MGQSTVRKPAVAGRFYPNDPVELREKVEQYIALAGVKPAPERTRAVIAPHAGYMFSGPTAGFAYARIRGKRPRRVILLGCSHRYALNTASVYTQGGFSTPLGVFPIDEEFAERVAELMDSNTMEAHQLEHALEVQLPFLHAVAGEVSIVPILFGAAPNRWHAEMGIRLAEMTDEDDLLIVSTDLSHYLTEELAHRKDKQSLDTFLTKDWSAYAGAVASGACAMCGAPAVAAGMTYAQAIGAEEWTLLDYRTSADASGDHDRVVGYAAVSMEVAE